MSALIDFEKIAKVFTRHNERVVVVVPGMEPVVLVPLNQYDELVSHKQPSQKPADQANKAPAKPAVPVNKPPQTQQPKPHQLEQIDPLQGGLDDDDQYFPEPL